METTASDDSWPGSVCGVLRRGARFDVLGLLSHALIALIAIVLCGTTTSAQTCTGAWTGMGGVPGVNGSVYASTLWDPDGPGPLPARLVVGGQFTVAGTTSSNCVAMWDGQSWQALGNGPMGPGSASVYALAVFNNQLVAGGYFYDTNSQQDRGIMRWNGTDWQPLGGGINGWVRTLAVYDNQLIAGGNFSSAGGVEANSIARWDGIQWHPLGTGISSGSYFGVAALATWNGELIVGGQFGVAGAVPVENVARWNGSAWSAFTSQPRMAVRAISVFNNEIVAGGDTTSYAFSATVKRWTGTDWQAFVGPAPGLVSCLTVRNGALYAGGTNTVLSGVHLAICDGTTWTPFAVAATSSADVVSTLTSLNGDLVAGGTFATLGNTAATNITRLGEMGWSSLGSGLGGHYPFMKTAIEFNGQVIAGGYFLSSDGTSALAKWDGAAWQPLSSGLGISTGSSDSPAVYGLGIYQQELIVTGSFFTADGVVARGIARWNGTVWRPLGTGLQYDLGGGGQPMIVFNNVLVLGGYFTRAGGVLANNIARWDGVTWRAMGSGFNNSVYAFALLDNQLIAAGAFDQAGGVPIHGVARWNGSAWEPLGSGLSGTVYALSVWEGQLYAGGNFCLPFPSPGPLRVARWDGHTWTPVGTGLNGIVYSLAIVNNELYAAGTLTSANGAPASKIARWNGATWQGLGAGLGPIGLSNGYTAWGMTVLNNQIVPLGDFNLAGGQGANMIARWTPGDAAPSVVQHPASATRCQSSAATFSCSAAAADGLGYKWQVRSDGGSWQDLGPTPAGVPCGSGVSSAMATGAATRSMTLTTGVCVGNPASVQRFRVQCLVINTCGTTATNEAIYTICPADFNCSGQVNAQDLFDVLNAWFAHDPRTDFNGDGALSADDLFVYVAAWFARC